jgi:hypothetical protein
MLALAVAYDTVRTQVRHPEFTEDFRARQWRDAAQLPVVDVPETKPVMDLKPVAKRALRVPTLLWHDGQLIWDEAL